MQHSSLVGDLITETATCLEVNFPAQRYVKFPRMQWVRLLLLGCLVEVADKKVAN